jgi:dihydroneopterin aldolase
LTEAVAEDIAQQILADTAAVHWVTVRVAKPWVRLADTVLRGSAVIIERSR